MVTSTYTVVGMTCGHCVSAVSTEMARLAGVSHVEVDLDSGSVTVTSAETLAVIQVVAAVNEAGYELVAGGPGTS